MIPAPSSKMSERIILFVSSSVALLFAVFLFAEHRQIFPYHDDWGLAVLDYATEIRGFRGQEFSLLQVLAFLEDMYFAWSGRIIAFFFQIHLFKFGIVYVRLFQVAVILSITYFSLKLPTGKGLAQPLVILPVALYFALPQYALVGGLFWFSAAAGYVWGHAFLLSGAWMIKRHTGIRIGASLLVACSAGFHEQLAVAACGFLATYILLTFLDNTDYRVLWRNLLYFIPVLAVSVLTVFAPGNFKRQESSSYPADDLLGVITANADALTNWLVLHQQITIFLTITLIALGIMALRFFSLQANKAAAAVLLGIVSGAMVLAWFQAPMAFLFLYLLCFGLLLFMLRKEHEFGNGMLALYAGALCSMVVLLVSPGVAGRSMLPFLFLMFPLICHAFLLLPASRIWLNSLAIAIALLSFIPSMTTTSTIYRGYQGNVATNIANDNILRVARFQYDQAGSIDQPLHLYKLPNPQYAETMPYQRPLIEKWIKKYYGLPADITFNWEEPGLTLGSE